MSSSKPNSSKPAGHAGHARQAKQLTTKSALIRELHDDGYTITEIAKQLNIHYSFAHGVVRRHEAKQANNATPQCSATNATSATSATNTANATNTAKPKSTSAKIRELHSAGQTTAQIVAELDVTHSFVCNVVRLYRTGGKHNGNNGNNDNSNAEREEEIRAEHHKVGTTI